MKSVKETLTKLLEYKDNKNHWKHLIIINWKDIIGKMHDQISIEKIEKDLIVLSVSNSSLMNQIFFLTNIIQNKINKLIKSDKIKRVRLKLRKENIFNKKKIYFKINKYNKLQNNLKNNIQLSTKENLALNKIKDKNLAQALKYFLEKCLQ